MHTTTIYVTLQQGAHVATAMLAGGVGLWAASTRSAQHAAFRLARILYGHTLRQVDEPEPGNVYVRGFVAHGAALADGLEPQPEAQPEARAAASPATAAQAAQGGDA